MAESKFVMSAHTETTAYFKFGRVVLTTFVASWNAATTMRNESPKTYAARKVVHMRK